MLMSRWSSLRSLCDNSKRLGVALALTADLPPLSVIDRWMSEPIKAVTISTSLFLTNKKGYPVLPKAHQHVIKQFFKVIVTF